MQIAITGRHIDITDSMRDYIEDKLGRLPRYYDRLESLDVVIDQESAKHRIEVVAHADHKHTFVAHVETDDFYEGIDLVLDKMERQLSKHKEKHRNRKHLSKPPQTSDNEE